ALVAIAFQPARRRTQQWANRAVYGQRASPYEVLARFSHRAAEASDDELLARMPRLIVDGTGAVEATIWVRSDEGFRAAATWPESVERTEIRGTDSFEDSDADYSLAVFHDGELLGGLSLVKTRGEALPPAEEQLVANLASGMGLALRNAGLTSQLREQVAELEASRERILAAADEARRALEHDLDSGPQQQLVALKVMLGPTRKRAVQAGATRTAEVLARLEADAGEAIRAVREFSGGVYPPLLEAEGLATAITHQTQKAALPVDVEADGLDRYSREVEAAVYFTILEALQNIAKYAGASTVSVVLRQADGRLSFEVTDDGNGFDTSMVAAGSGLANMADRLDAVGATLSLESVPGSGTTIRSTVPIGDRVNV
ncbi:MAG: ATP-binding protein, partial [Acidimicrobiia bacterium]